MEKISLVLAVLFIAGSFTIAIGDDVLKQDGEIKPATTPAVPSIVTEFRKSTQKKLIALQTNFTLDKFNEMIPEAKAFAANKEYTYPANLLVAAVRIASSPAAVKAVPQLAEKTIKEFIEFVKSDQFNHPEDVKKSVIAALEKERILLPLKKRFTLDEFNKTVAELKVAVAKPELKEPDQVLLTVIRVAEKPEAVNADPQLAEKTVKDFIEFVKSDQFDHPENVRKTTIEKLEQKIAQIENITRRSLGADLKLFGKNVDDSDFDWTSLQGKYVVVKFTATWCGPCKAEIPGLIRAYKKYHDKGLEIVSVYVWERGEDNDKLNDRIKEFAAKEKIDWKIISEPLTLKAGGEKIGEFYGVQGVPTMLLIGKDGKIIDTEVRGQHLQDRLAKIFD